MFNLDTNLKKELWFLVRLFVLSFVGTTILFWVAEQGKNEIDNYTDVIWWWVVTSTTVGYGDITPSSMNSKIVVIIHQLCVLINIVSFLFILYVFIQKGFR